MASRSRHCWIPRRPLSPTAHFPDLIPARDRLVRACQGGEALAVCGDYDADGMTSTALLVGCLRRLGALVRGAIPAAWMTATD